MTWVKKYVYVCVDIQNQSIMNTINTAIYLCI